MLLIMTIIAYYSKRMTKTKTTKKGKLPIYPLLKEILNN